MIKIKPNTSIKIEMEFPRGFSTTEELKKAVEEYCEKYKITAEPELTEFEQALKDLIVDWGHSVEYSSSEFVKKRSHILLSLAKDQLRKDGYIVEKHNELFDRCVKNIDDKLLATIQVVYGCHVLVRNGHRHAELGWEQFQKVALKFYAMGKADVLKDVPRWRKYGNGACGGEHNFALVRKGEIITPARCLTTGDEYILFTDLNKLSKDE